MTDDRTEKRKDDLPPRDRLVMTTIIGAPLSLLGSFLEYSFRGDHTTTSTLFFVVGLTLLALGIVRERTRLRRAIFHRSSALGLNNVILIFIVFLVVVLLNLIATTLCERVVFLPKFDFTRNAFFTLSPDSLNVLAEIDEPTTVLVFHVAPRGAGTAESQVRRHRNQLRTLMNLYGAANPLIHWRFVDPEEEPATAERYAVQLPGTVVLEQNDNRIIVRPWSIFQPSNPIRGTREAFLGEQALTNALRRLNEAKQPTVYFTVGHGERNLNEDRPEGLTRLAEYLRRDHYRLYALNLQTTSFIPADAAAIVIAGATSELTPEVERLLRDYLQGGGNMMVLVDERPPRSIARLVEPFGINLRDNYVIDLQDSFFNRPTWPIPKLNGHIITDELIRYHRRPTFPGATALTQDYDANVPYTVRTIAQTSRQSWAETDFTQARPSFDEGVDEPGPLSVALAITSDRTTIDSSHRRSLDEFRFVIVGDSDFVTNRAIDMQTNADFFLNSLAWVTGVADRIAIRPREVEAEKIPLTDGQGAAIFYAFSLGLPLVYTLVGLVLWFRRRHR